MPRIRSIKPEFWSSPSVTAMSPMARLLFIAMWNWADDAGRGTYFPRELMGFAFPNDEDMSVADFRGIVAEIRRHCAVEFYDVAGRHYFEIPSWKKHQSRHAKLSASKYPGPEDGDPIDPESLQVIGTVPESRRNSGDSRRNSGAPNRESVLGTGEQGNRGTGEGVEEISDPTGYPQAVDKSPQPQNLDELAAATAASNSLVCSRHPDGNATGEACWECGQVKKRRQETEQQARDEAKAKRRAAIDACDLCDDNGIRYADGQAHRCTHKPEPPF